jgi:streptomycin 6-kinase
LSKGAQPDPAANPNQRVTDRQDAGPVSLVSKLMSQPEIPESFRRQPRWWNEGHDWVDALPGLVRRQCESWGLEPDGRIRHGSNAVVLPVRRQGERYALRMSPPDARTAEEIRALQFWAGRGTARLIEADPGTGASLLEWLDADRSLASIDRREAGRVLGALMRRLAVPVEDPAAVPATGDLIAARIETLESDWDAVGRPFPQSILQSAITAGRALSTITDAVAVNGDLHHDQVLAAEREPWLVVDPMLLRGDIGYDLARCLWWRLDDLPDDAAIGDQLLIIADAAGLDHDHARTSVIYRTVDYWLWGLRHGLTEDPARCRRLVQVVG